VELYISCASHRSYIKGAFRNLIREVDQSGQRNLCSPFDWSIKYYFTLPIEFPNVSRDNASNTRFIQLIIKILHFIKFVFQIFTFKYLLRKEFKSI